jgi:hypothetical protein
MYKAERALDERTEYSQLGPNRWRATYRGFVTLSSEGRDPKNAQFNLDEAFDLLLANLIRTSHRPLQTEPDVVVQETVESHVTNATPADASSQNDDNAPRASRTQSDDCPNKTLRFRKRR